MRVVSIGQGGGTRQDPKTVLAREACPNWYVGSCERRQQHDNTRQVGSSSPVSVGGFRIHGKC